MKKLILSVVAITLILAVSAGVYLGLMATKKTPEKKETKIQRTLVEVIRTQKQTVSFDIHSQGTVIPRTETTLYPEVSGEIIYVSPGLVAGGFFKAGDLLLKIDASNYELAVIIEEAELARAEVALLQESALSKQALKDWIALGNTKESATTLVLREPQLKEAEANIRSAQAGLSRAQRDLRKTEICAPYEGMVRRRLSDLGQVVNQGSELAEIFAIDFVEIRLPLTAEDIRFLDLPQLFRQSHSPDEGLMVVLRSRFGGLSERWDGHIVRTEGTIDPKTRVMYAVARVEDPYGRREVSDMIPMSVGMFVEAVISGKTYENVVMLPRYALRGKNQVLVVNEDDELNRRDVGVLRTDSGNVYIGSGLEEGERVCLTALEFVVEGMPVEAVEGDDSLVVVGSRGSRLSSL